MGKKNRKSAASSDKEASVMSVGSSGQAPASLKRSQDDKGQLIQLIHNLEQARAGTRCLVYWTTDIARVAEAVVHPLYDQLCAMGKQPALDLVLFTRGGDTEVPLRLVTLIREFCDRFSVLVPYRCHSSGTMIAMGSDEVVMSPLGVLGPIDPTRTHPLLPRREGAEQAEPISVQDMRHAMQFIMETARPGPDIHYTPEAMAQIVIALFDKIHPLAIGAIEQSYALAKLVGSQCLATHMDPVRDKDRIDAIVNTLCDDYKSHAYQINRDEARRIGLNVIDAQPDVNLALMDILRFYLSRHRGGPEGQPATGQTFKLHIAWLDSADLQFRVEQDNLVLKGNQIQRRADMWTPY